MTGAFGAGLVVLGLVISNVLFMVGCFLLVGVLVEWMVLAWSDRATGDPEVNRRLRRRMHGALRGAPGRRSSSSPAVSSPSPACCSPRLAVRAPCGSRPCLVSPSSHRRPPRRRPKLSHSVVAGVLSRGRARRHHRRRRVGRPRRATIEPHSEEHEERGGHAASNRHPGRHEPARDHHRRRGRGLMAGRTPPSLARLPSWSRWGWRSAPAPMTRRWTPSSPQGPEAQTIDDLAVPVFIVAGIVFVLVQGGVLYLVWSSASARTTTTACRPQVHGNTKLELGWTILPAAPARRRGRRAPCSPSSTSTRRPEDAQEVKVIGQQWWWEYRYDVDGDGEDDIVTANDMVIPAGEPIALDHHLARRHPLVLDPGAQRQEGRRPRAAPTPSRSRPTSPACTGASAPSSAACPTPTCSMRVVALSAGDYAAWEARPARGRRWMPDDELAMQGQELFRTTCSACHLDLGRRRQRGRARGGRHRRGRPGGGRGTEPHPLRQPRRVRRWHLRSLGRPGRQRRGRPRRDRRGAQRRRPRGVAARSPRRRSRWLRTSSAACPTSNLTEEQIDALVAYLETLE